MRLRRGRALPARTLVVAVMLCALAAGPTAARAAPVTTRQAGLLPGLLSGLAGQATPPPPSAPPGPPAPAPCAAGTTSSDTPLMLSSGGLARTAVLHLPPSVPGKPLALIVAFHGYGSNGVQFAADSGLSTLGDTDGFAVVYPSALGHQWAISGRERDVGFIADLLDRVEQIACIDTRRVYATGLSIGAGMAARIGCELSARIAGLVLVSGGYRSLGACKTDRPVSVLEIHGTSDKTVPYHGRGPGEDGAVLPFIASWASRDRCNQRPAKRMAAVHAVLYHWSGCASGAVVEHLRLYGSGHGLPNADGPQISAGYRGRISGVRNIWHFLAARKLGDPFS